MGKSLSLTTEQVQKILTELAKGDLSLTRVTELAYGKASTYNELRAETEMDELWDKHLVVNLGHYQNYRWRITKQGNDYLQQLLGKDKLPR